MSGPGRHFLVRADEIHMGSMSELAPIKLINLGCVAESAAQYAERLPAAQRRETYIQSTFK